MALLLIRINRPPDAEYRRIARLGKYAHTALAARLAETALTCLPKRLRASRARDRPLIRR
jgi:hypothetical protein